MGRTVDAVFESAKRVMEHALLGEADYLAGGERRLSGLYTAVSSGRSVTFVLQNLRSVIDHFDDWYLPVQSDMKSNPVFKYFHDLRNRIEKEGDHGSGAASVFIEKLNTRDFMSRAPVGTTSMFMGDSLGRSGWTVALPDGSETVVYFDVPASVGTVQLLLTDAPGERDFGELLREWLAAIEAVYLEAVERFAPAVPGLTLDRPNTTPFDKATTAALAAVLRESRFGQR